MFINERQARLACAQLLLSEFGGGGKVKGKGSGRGAAKGSKGNRQADDGRGWTFGGKGPTSGGELGRGPWRGQQQNQWPCHVCSFANRHYRTACFQCGEPRPKGAGKRSDGGKGGKDRGRQAPAAIGANGYGPMLGRRDKAGGTKAGKGTGAEVQPGPTFAEKGGGRAAQAMGAGPHGAASPQPPPRPGAVAWGGKAGGKASPSAKDQQEKPCTADGFTRVCYSSGSRPRVLGSGKQGTNVNTKPTAADAAAASGTRFHALAEEDEDDGDAEGRMDEDLEEQEYHDDGEEQQEQDDRDPLEDARELLRTRENMYRAHKRTFGGNHPAVKTAYEDVLAAQKHLQCVRGPKAWHVQARQDQKKAEAKQKAADEHKAMHAHNERMFKEWMVQLQEEQDHRQRQLEEAIEAEEREAQELWDRVEQCRGKIPRHVGGGQAGWARDGATSQKLVELAQQISAITELAQSNASEEVQQGLAELKVQMLQLEDNMGNEADDDYAEDDWYEEQQQYQDLPPWRWRSGDGGWGENFWHTAQDGTQQRTHGSVDDAWMDDGAGDDGNRDSRPTDPGSSAKGGGKGGGAKAKAAGAAKDEGAGTSGTPKADGGSVGPQPSAAQQAADAAMLQAQRAAAEAAAAAAAAEATAKRQRAIDKIRGRLQAERERDLEAKQRESGINTLEDAKSWTQEQLDEHTKQLEEFYRWSEQEAERLYAQMPEEERAKLIEGASR